jgi:DNA-binding response OmpR family regulator
MTERERSKVLLAEDSTTLRACLQRYLERAGFHVVSVAEGWAAVKALDREFPDAMVVDRRMPYVSGDEVCRHAARDGRFIRVVVISAYGEPRPDVLEDLPSARFLPKPFAPRDLVAMLRGMLDAGGTGRAEGNGKGGSCHGRP